LSAWGVDVAFLPPFWCFTVLIDTNFFAACCLLLDLSRRNRFHPVKQEDSLFDVVKILVNRHIHRVPVLGANGKVVNIISQSTVASVMNDHLKNCSDATVAIRDLDLGTKEVLSVPMDTKAMSVFRIMDNKKLSGVAVVDENGRLVGNTSGSDLKLFLKSMSHDLLQKPIFEYLKDIRMESVDIRHTTFTINATNTLSVVIGKFAATRAHRLFVANDETGFLPERVVAISDLLKWVLSTCD
jgi:CBS-domain-containing membrane protein